MPAGLKAFLRPRAHQFALEARQLFDGAAFVEAAHAAQAPAPEAHVADAHAAPAPDKGAAVAAIDAAHPITIPDAPAPQAATHTETTVYVVDKSVAQWETLVAQLPAGSDVILLEAGSNGTAQLAQALSGRSGIDSLQIISHGVSGGIVLGNETLNAGALQASATAAQWQAIGAALSADGDILLYGCDTAADGQAFIGKLASITQADVAASTNDTGASARGGDWTLEARTGSVESAVLAGLAYDNLLAAPTITDGATETFVAVGENDADVAVGLLISVTGTGSDVLNVTASAGKGTLNATAFSGTAAQVQTWINALTYSYSATSETGDTDTLAISITNTTNGGTANFTRDIHVAPQNDAPVLNPPSSGAGRLSVFEGGSASFSASAGTGTAGSPVTQINLGLLDKDNTPNQIIVKLTGLPSAGVLLLNGNELSAGSTFAMSDIANLVYKHNGAQVLTTGTTDTFMITVDDGAGGLVQNQSVTVDLKPVNQTPDAGGRITLIEGETGVKLVGENIPVLGAERGNLTISDADDTVHKVTVTALPTHGVLRYNGLAVTLNQVINNADLTKFTYDHDGSETTGDTFKIIVEDNGGGTVTHATSAEKTIELVIVPNNDDPTLAHDTGVVFGPDSALGAPLDTTSVVITPAMLQVVDSDSPDSRLTYTLTAIPSGGYLTFAATGLALPVGYSFTQADLAAGNIKFVSTTGSDFTTDFKFTVKDGDRRILPNARDGGIYVDNTAAAALAINTFTIQYKGTTTGPGDGGSFPAFAVPNAPGGSLSLNANQIAEGQTVTLTQTHLNTTDSDNTAEQLTYRLLSTPTNGSVLLNGVALGLYGSFTQQDVNDGKVSFRHDGGEDFTSSFLFDVSDGSSKTAATTFNIDVKPQNDSPTAASGVPVKLTESGTKVINGSNIVLADADNATIADGTSDKDTGYAADNTLSFRVTVLPVYGKLQLNGVDVLINQVITKSDLLANKLTYVHFGDEQFTDAFTLVPVDDRGVTVAGTGVGLPATDPTNQLSEGAPLVVAITINPLNDAPTYVDKAEPGYGSVPKLAEGALLTIYGATTYANPDGSGTATAPAATVAHLLYQDADNTTEQRQYRVTTITEFGTLTANGRVLNVGSVFTQAELDAGLVKYQHNGAENTSDFFEYVVSDGDYGANDATSSNATAFPQGTAITPSRYNILMERGNDKPAITAGGTSLTVNSSVTGVALPAITLADVDLADGVAVGETDFVQVSLEFLNGANTAYADGVLYFNGGSTPAGVTVTNAAGDSTLVFQGTMVDVQAALDAVRVRTGTGVDADLNDLKIKVTVDDRLRDAGGVLVAGANGGAVNSNGLALSDANNTASVLINVSASSVNDAPVITAGAQTVNEDVRTLLTGISYTDPDAFGSTSGAITLTVNTGTLYFTSSDNTVPAGVTVTGGSVGSNSVTLTGTKAGIDAALASLYYRSALNYNGDDSLTVSINDGGNTGIDAGGGSTDSKMVAIAILPVNDRPTIEVPSGIKLITGGNFAFTGAGNTLAFDDVSDLNPGPAGFQTGVNNFTVTLEAKLAGAYNGAIAVDAAFSGLITTNATGLLVLTGSRAQVNAALATATYSPGNSNADAIIDFTMTVDDHDNGGTAIAGVAGPQTQTGTFQFAISDANAAPSVVGLDATSANTFTENGSAVVVDANATLLDPELDIYPQGWSGATLTIQRTGGADPQDVFGVTGSGNTGINFSGANIRSGTTVLGTFTNTGGSLTFTFNTAATPALVDSVMQAVTYRNTSEAPPASVSLTYLVDDQNNNAGGAFPVGPGQDQGAGGKLTGSAVITVNINRVVDVPVISAAGAAAAYTENGSGTVVDGGITLTDADDANIAGATVQVTSGLLSGDVLAVATGGTSITATYDSGTGTLTLAGTDTKAHYEQVLRSLTYSSTSDAPTSHDTPANRTRVLTYTVLDDGSSGAAASGANSATTTRTVNVTPVNDTPVLAGAGSTQAYTENGAPLLLEPGAWTLTDVDDTQMTQVTVQITGGLTAGDVLAAGTVPGGWTQSYNAGTGTLTLSGAATGIANVVASLQAVTYASTSDDPGNGARTITWQVRDANSDAASNGTLLTNTVTTTVNVTPVNDPPVAIDDTNTVTEDSGTPATGNVKTGAGSPATTPDSDPDNTLPQLNVTLIGGSPVAGGTTSATGTVIAGTYGTLTIGADGSYSYVLDNTNATVNGLNGGDTLTDVFSYTLSDGTATDSANLTITINGHTDGAPTIAPVDGNAGATGEATVHEAGLTSGGDTRETTTGSVTVTAPDGVASVTIGGTTFSVAQLTGFTPGSPSTPIDTGEGLLSITGITVVSGSPGAPVEALVNYSYTLKAPISHGGGATESTDTIALTVTDNSAGHVTANGTLVVQIVDDVPTANNDAAGISLDGPADPAAGGNVLTGGGARDVADRPGADTATTVTAVEFDGAPVALGTPITAHYGHLTLNADGSYTYTADSSNPAVKNLSAGQTLVEVFTYTITDADGDTSTATLTVTLVAPESRVPGGVDPVFNGVDQRDPPAIFQPFEPALFVQFAVKDSASLSGSLAAMMADGLGVPDGAEIQSDIGGISQNMTNTQHVSRDGVAFSTQLLAEGQSRARGIGNSTVVGAQTLFDDFSAFSPNAFGGQVAGAEQTADASDATRAAEAPVRTADVAPPRTAPPRTTQPIDLPAAASFSEQLAAMAAQKPRPVKVAQATART